MVGKFITNLIQNKTSILETEMDKLLLTTPMKIVKGWVHCSLSRASVEWMFQKLDPSIFMHQLNQGVCFETLFQIIS